ncbi:hypothetical protein AB204_16820 [Xenorhabdus khoisanae]|uniref:Uncharacterized protein n=1 Tax=Xenorhabdus khoisanae TaxID=880157 RepID=A0A0J5FPD1_9GAMM|nr:hypothetical protein AB204_16820 [Xenorhabdus khoisanae]
MRQPAPQLMVPVVIVVVVFVVTIFFGLLWRIVSCLSFNLSDPLLVKLNCGQCQIFFMAKAEKSVIFRTVIIQNMTKGTHHYLAGLVIF